MLAIPPKFEIACATIRDQGGLEVGVGGGKNTLTNLISSGQFFVD